MNSRVYRAVVLSGAIIAAGCQTSPSSPEDTPTQDEPVVYVSNPAQAPSGEPNLFVGANGQVYLSWVEATDPGHQLRYAVWDDEQWADARTIAQGDNWFVNWADFPSLAVTDTFAAAHWLQKSAAGTYDYDVRVALSTPAQDRWRDTFVLHQDGRAAEHGFVTLLPLSASRILSVWLDGRHTKQEGGAMNLYANTITTDGTSAPGQCLDDRVCDCCQTDAALTDRGAVVVYRNRTEDEVRDIYTVRQTPAGWSAPQPVHEDHWQIAGCPVNGPAISARNKTVAVAWFTAANEAPQVQVAFSDDRGETFGEPWRLDEQPALGRVDIELIDTTTAVVSWMETTENGAAIRLQAISKDGSRGHVLTVADTPASRSSGFPIIALSEERLHFAWTLPSDSLARVQTAWAPIAYFQTEPNL